MQIEVNPPLAAVRRLLAAADLPTADITAHQLAHFLFCRSAGEIIGIVGIEPYGSIGMLRSLAVADSWRGRGHGTALVAAAEARALQTGIDTLYLLTLTAETFFRRHGYATLPRQQAPAAIQKTPEFTGLCPATAVLMGKRLSG
ncbi:MAG: arsenic resistance N-acetyltransferase ArsN2 [Desulfosarcinaceae bacterium]|nr:arsenic resistance N-acetyltransferase ArsN2 [Desulfosarcinaceae bacterium]